MLEDIDGVDPYAECREAVLELHYSDRKQYWERSLATARSPEEVRRKLLDRLEFVMQSDDFIFRSYKGVKLKATDPHVILVKQQVESPAFLRYISGLMGAM